MYKVNCNVLDTDTLTLPPPGLCLALSIEPILLWALTLKSTFSFTILIYIVLWMTKKGIVDRWRKDMAQKGEKQTKNIIIILNIRNIAFVTV